VRVEWACVYGDRAAVAVRHRRIKERKNEFAHFRRIGAEHAFNSVAADVDVSRCLYWQFGAQKSAEATGCFSRGAADFCGWLDGNARSGSAGRGDLDTGNAGQWERFPAAEHDYFSDVRGDHCDAGWAGADTAAAHSRAGTGGRY